MTNAPTLRVKKLHPNAKTPRYQTDCAAGMDLHACCDAPVVIESGCWARVPTGIALALPPGHEGQVRPRSGLAAKHGVTVLNAPGTIDEDYRGEVQVLLLNVGTAPFAVQDGDRIAQLIVAPVTRVATHAVSDLDATARGSQGFGSTGVR